MDEINAKSAQTGLKIDRTRLYVTGVRHVDTYYTKTNRPSITTSLHVRCYFTLLLIVVL